LPRKRPPLKAIAFGSMPALPSLMLRKSFASRDFAEAEASRGTLSDRPVVELKRRPVGRIKRALVGSADPDMVGVIDPASHRHAGLEIEVPAILRDVGDPAERADA
jgi:hypothetical protein